MRASNMRVGSAYGCLYRGMSHCFIMNLDVTGRLMCVILSYTISVCMSRADLRDYNEFERSRSTIESGHRCWHRTHMAMSFHVRHGRVGSARLSSRREPPACGATRPRADRIETMAHGCGKTTCAPARPCRRKARADVNPTASSCAAPAKKGSRVAETGAASSAACSTT